MSISIAFKRNHIIEAILPLLLKKGKYGNVINSLPFFGSNGGILSTNVEAEKYLFEHYYKMLLDYKVLSSTLISNPFLHKIKYKSDMKDKRLSQWTNLTELIQPGYQKSGKSVKRNLKKAILNEITVIEDKNALNFIQEVHIENMSSINGKIKPNIFFDSLDQYLDYGKDYKIYVAKRESEYIAGLLIFQSSSTIEYVMPVTKIKFRHLQPSSIILHQAMIDAKKNGYKRWNWGGTWFTQEGVFKFKKNGVQLVILIIIM